MSIRRLVQAPIVLVREMPNKLSGQSVNVGASNIVELFPLMLRILRPRTIATRTPSLLKIFPSMETTLASQAGAQYSQSPIDAEGRAIIGE